MPEQPPTHQGPKPPASREDAVDVVRRLREAGQVAYFAGGCVRDLLLGREPKDFDVATDAPPPRVRQLFTNTQAIGAAFGVILVRLRRSMIEVATFRADGNYKDGRHPEGVRFTTAEEDAKRRDFTINGLFLDPLDGDRVLDFVGGKPDLAARVVRAIGEPDRRFEEDHLRLLRAVRFAARFGFDIEPATADAIRRHAKQLKRISPERIAEELRIMLTPATRGLAWRLLQELALVPEVFRFLPGVPADPSFDAHDWLFDGVAPAPPWSFGLVLATSLVTLGMQWHQRADHYTASDRLRQALRGLRQGLKISNEESDDVIDTLEGFALVLSDSLQSVAAKKRFLARPCSTHALSLLDGYARRAADGPRIASAVGELRLLQMTEFAPLPLLTGDDLTAAGQTPGPAFKRVLDGVYDAQLENRVTTKEAALELGLSLMRRPT